MASFDDPKIHRGFDHRDISDDARRIWADFLSFIHTRRHPSQYLVPEAAIAEDLLNPDQIPSLYMETFFNFLRGYLPSSPLINGVGVIRGRPVGYSGPSWLQLDGNGDIAIQLNLNDFPDESIHCSRKATIAIVHELAHAIYHWDDTENPLKVTRVPNLAPPSLQFQEMQAWWWGIAPVSLWAGAIALNRPSSPPTDSTLGLIFDP